jgi:hypothetical protein
MSEKKYTFINVRFDEEMTSMLDGLVAEDTQLTGVKMDRAKTVKRLIRFECERRIETGTIVTELPAPEGAIAPVLIGIRSNAE